MTRRTTSPTSSGRRSEWGSWRRGPWRSWWSPWPVTPGSSSPPTSMSSSPPTGPLLQQNKSLTSSRRGKWNKFYFKTFMLRVFVRTFLPSVLIMVMYSYIALKWTCVTGDLSCQKKIATKPGGQTFSPWTWPLDGLLITRSPVLCLFAQCLIKCQTMAKAASEWNLKLTMLIDSLIRLNNFGVSAWICMFWQDTIWEVFWRFLIASPEIVLLSNPVTNG